MRKTGIEKGITLIALIITIVVLLILAAVAIASIQNDGILSYAENATKQYNQAVINEHGILGEYLNYLEKNGQEEKEEIVQHNNIVPEGGKYTTVDGTVFNPGDSFPESVSTGDMYQYGDYEYRYNQYYYLNGEWTTDDTQNGWAARVLDESKEEYGKIAEVINEKAITSLRRAFMMCNNLIKSPEIPDTVTNMSMTFYEDDKLVDIPENFYPENVQILDSLFSMCISFSDTEALKLPAKVTSADGVFANNKFENNDLQFLIIPETLTSLDSLFWDNDKLTDASSFSIPSWIEEMPQAFANCSNLTIGPDFSKATSLTSLEETFMKCVSLQEVPTLSKATNITSMKMAFYGCESLRKIPNLNVFKDLKDMSYAFYECASLGDVTGLTIGATVETMTYAFYKCSKLSGTITINTSLLTSVNHTHCCFYGTEQPIILKGTASTTIRQQLADTSTNGNVTVE